MIKRGHDCAMISRGWETHLVKFAYDKVTRYTELRTWFRRMMGYEIAVDSAIRWGQHKGRQQQQRGLPVQPWRQRQQPAALNGVYLFIGTQLEVVVQLAADTETDHAICDTSWAECTACGTS
jgi:hypothetical protein